MARLVLTDMPAGVLPIGLPLKDRIQLALQHLREDPNANPTTTARIYKIEKNRQLDKLGGMKRRG